MTPSVCNACGASTLATRFDRVRDPQTGEIFSILECPKCGLGHTAPQPADLAPYYGAAYHGGRHGFTADYCARRRLRIVEEFSARGDGSERHLKLLDVGCGDGTFLLRARDAGWQVAGTEMNAQIARAAGLDVRANVEEFRDLAPFDAITLWHSLEHIRDPRALVASLLPLLSETGHLVIAVPDADGLQARAFGAKWLHLDAPRHLFHFGEKSLTALLERCGFRPVRWRHQEFEYDLLGWSQSALNCLMPKPNVFFNSLAGKPTGAGAVAVAANNLLGASLSVLSLPAVPLSSMLGRGGTLVVAAQRKE